MTPKSAYNDLRIDQWVAAQLAWVRCFSLAEARFWAEHRRAIVRWHLRLLQAGFDVPLFLVADLSFLIQHSCNGIKNFGAKIGGQLICFPCCWTYIYPWLLSHVARRRIAAGLPDFQWPSGLWRYRKRH